jgi:CarD family transcriptional regulator
MYGAGIIEDMQDREIDGSTARYYIMRIPVGNLTIMVSIEKVEQLGIRAILSMDDATKAITAALTDKLDMSANWNQRYKDNMLKIKSGDLREVAQVYMHLLQRERERGISCAEKKVLTQAKQIILSELILSKNIEKLEAEDLLNEMVGVS